jgi:ATP-dependent DNA helicase RecG
MRTKELIELVNKIQETKSESRTIELKTAEFGCPKKLYDTFSSFSNQDDGGVIIFGIDESKDYSVVGVYDVQDLQKQINNQCKEMEPVVRPLITICDIDGKNIVSAEIPGIEITNRPCYYKGKGKIKGSYIRSGDSDEPMTDYEIYSYEAYRQKYQDDIRTIDRASLQTIDTNKLDAYKAMCKKNKPHLAKVPDEQFDELMSITKDGKLTLSSVLLFCIYPQAYFPQLSIIATAVYGNEMGELGENGERFLDNKRIEGSIDDMIDGALQFVKNNMRMSTIIDPKTGKRNDKFDYPITAVREVILNALVHRDYSIHTEGMPIQITMYNDRLEVKNPGGLYGRLTIDQLGKVQPDTRNPVLATAMETMNITENRYSGIPTIRMEMKNAGLPAPLFEDKRGTFTVTLFKNSEKAKFSSNTNESILDFCSVPRSRIEIANFIGVSTPTYAISKYIKPLIKEGKIDITNPERPNSPNQKYFTK